MQVRIVRSDDPQEVIRMANDALDELSPAKIVDVKMSTASAGPIEDQWVVTTVMIVYEEA